jgi:cell division initiation protein
VEVTPRDVQHKQFDYVKRGFDPQQVGVFLDQVAATLVERDGALNEARAELDAASRTDAGALENQEAFRLTLSVAAETMEEMLRSAGERASRIEEEANTAAEVLVERARIEAEDKVASVKKQLELLEGERTRLESWIAERGESDPPERSSGDAGGSDEPTSDRPSLELVVDRAQEADAADGSGLAARVGDLRG